MKRGIWALLFLFLTCGSRWGVAGSITYQTPFTITMTRAAGESNYSGTITVNLPQFPGSQFDLTGVTLDVNGAIQAAATAQNLGNTPGTFDVRYVGSFQGTGPGPRMSDLELGSTVAASPLTMLEAYNGINGSGPSYVDFGMLAGATATESIPTFGLFRLYAGAGTFPVTVAAGEHQYGWNARRCVPEHGLGPARRQRDRNLHIRARAELARPHEHGAGAVGPGPGPTEKKKGLGALRILRETERSFVESMFPADTIQ